MKRRLSLSFASLAVVAAAAASSACRSHGDAPSVANVIEAASTSGSYAYAFDPSGLATSVGTNGSSYAITRHGDTITAGTSTYRLDALGRTVAIDATTLAYGPDGQIARATRGTHSATYLYDENGQRIAKAIDGALTAAYADEGYVAAAELDEPVRVAGRVVGMLRNGIFVLTATDTRGTVHADADGTTRTASPFGARPVHPDVARAIDYAATGFDDDLGADRMGVRDYDARIARFLEPDPLFLAHPEKCVTSPVECSLYGYARSRPNDFVDPHGTEAWRNDESPPRGGAGASAGASASSPAKPGFDPREAARIASNASCFGQACSSVRAQQAARWPFSISPMPYGAYATAGVEFESLARKTEFALALGHDPQAGWHVNFVSARGVGPFALALDTTLFSSTGETGAHVIGMASHSAAAGVGAGVGAWTDFGNTFGGEMTFHLGLRGAGEGGSAFVGIGGSITMDPKLKPPMDHE